MGDVTRIGGVFFRSSDPAATAAWYRTHLDLPTEEFHTAVLGEQGHEAVWAPFAEDSDYFGSADQVFMVNYVTADLGGLLARLRKSGVTVIDDVHESEFGRFGWAIDGDGRRFELWEPPSALSDP
jgi:predicted enzyme related to lactoylglutathione lyase